MRPVLVLSLCLSLPVVLAGCGGPRPPRPPNPYTSDYRPPRDENYHGGPNALLLKYDANHDGTLTKAEMQAGLHAEFDSYDTGHTGCLTPDQVSAINAQRITDDQSAATPLQDFRQNGCVDFSEFAAVPQSLFDELDKNNDGKITPQEFNPRTRGQGQSPAQGAEQGQGSGGGGTPPAGGPPGGPPPGGASP